MILSTTAGMIEVASRPRDPWGAYSSLPTDTYSGKAVTPEGALALVAVYGAVSLVSDMNGMMPLEVIDTRAASGRRLVEGGWLAPMLRHQPNEDMSGVDLWTYVYAQLMLRGNAYLAKIRDERGTIRELYPLLPGTCTPYRNANGAKTFRVQLFEGSTFVDYDFSPRDILHIKGKSITDPLVGESPIAHVRNAIGTHLAQKEYQARAYQDGMLLKGALSTESRDLSVDAAARMKAQWRSAYAGVGNSHEIAVLHSGVKFQPISLSPEDAQFIQTMKWGHTEVATTFKIPASRLNGEGASLVYANQGQDDLHLDKQACLPLRIQVQASLNRDPDLFGPTSPWIPWFNPAVALEADETTQTENDERERRTGTISVNEIRRRKNRPEIGPAGDDYTPLKSSATTTPAAPAQEGEA